MNGLHRVHKWLLAPLLGLGCLLLAPTTTGTNSKAADGLDCVVMPSAQIDISSAVPGLLEQVLVERSDPVKRGQVVAMLESGVEQASATLADGWAQFETEVLLQRVVLSNEVRKQARLQELYQRSVVAQELKEDSDAQVDSTRLKVQQALERRWLRELEAKKAHAALERRTVRSPVDGVILQRFRAAGEYVENQPIVRIAQLNPLHIETIIPMVRFGTIAVGDKATVIPEAPAQGSFEGTVIVVDAAGDAASGTFGVRLEIANDDYRVPAGLKCRLHFGAGEPPGQGGAAVNGNSTEASLFRASTIEATSQPGSHDVAAGSLEGPPTPGRDTTAHELPDDATVAAPTEGLATNSLATGVLENVNADADALAEIRRVAAETGDFSGESAQLIQTDSEANSPAIFGAESNPRFNPGTIARVTAGSASRPGSSSPAELTGPNTALMCGSVGPLAPAVGKTVSSALTKAGGQVDTRVEWQRRPLGFIVLSPAFADRSETQAYRQQLENGRVHDWQLLRTGRFKERFSLGTYVSRRVAEVRHAELTALGLDAELGPWTQAVERWWLDVTALDEAATAEHLLSVLAPHAAEGLTFERLPCPGLLAASP